MAISKKTAGGEATFRVVVIVSVPVAGKSLSEMEEVAMSLKVTDLVSIDGDYVDGSAVLVGVQRPGLWNTD